MPRRDQEETESNSVAGLCMKRLSPVPCPPLVKVEKKNPPENERCCLSFLQERRVEGTKRGEAGGLWGGALSLVTGVSASGV